METSKVDILLSMTVKEAIYREYNVLQASISAASFSHPMEFWILKLIFHVTFDVSIENLGWQVTDVLTGCLS